MFFLKEEHKVAVVTCIEIALMRRGDVNYNSVLFKLKTLYNCEIKDCLDHLEYLRTVLKEVYKQDYDSVLKDITWEFEALEINGFKSKFCEFMAS